MTFMSEESLAKKTLAILSQKSEKAHVIMRQKILEEKIGLKKPDKAIEQYLSKWNDTIRPGTLAIACEAVGGKLGDIVPLQVALSFIDVTMDIHDDIIDNSISKKNAKTIYGKLGNESTLLLGDAFMVKGFCNLHGSIENLPKDQQMLIIEEVNNFLTEVVYAHISEAQLKSRKWSVTPEAYLQILNGKAADIEGRMKIGAIYGGGSKKEIDALGEYGRRLGLLLAIRAEYIDIFEPSELSNRIKHECLPLQILYALQKSEYKNEIHSLLSKETIEKKDTYKLLELIQETKTLSSLNTFLKNLAKEAMLDLSKLDNNKEKSSLELFVSSMLEDL